MEVIANLFIAIMFFIIGVGVGNNKQKKQGGVLKSMLPQTRP